MRSLFSGSVKNGVPASARWLGILRHYLDKLAALTFGAVFVSRPVRAALERIDPPSLPVFSGRAALVAHVFYPALAGEIRECFGRLPAGSTLIVTAPVEKVAAVRAAFADIEGTRIVAVANRGRDIAPFLALLNGGELDGFDAVLKLHTKRSPHLLDGRIRRKLLYTQLAGSRRRIARVLAHFDEPGCGLVGWPACWRASRLFWVQNKDRVEALCREMAIATPDAPTFFEGSMFWVRPAALARLKRLALPAEAFEEEAGQLDGTLHHAVERLFATVAASDGFSTRAVSGATLLPAASGNVPVNPG